MSAVTADDILFRAGGVCLQEYGRPWWRGPYDRNEADAYTFTRADAATCATFVDYDLTIRKAAAGILRASWYDTDSDGVADVCGLLLESSRANICLQSEDFGTTWSAVGTPTRSAGAATCGAVSLDLIGDDSGAASEGYYQPITFTGDAVKAVSLFMKVGTSNPSGGYIVNLADITAGLDRLTATITWSGTVPTVTMTFGTHLRTVRLADGVYRFEFQTTSVTAANVNRLYVQQATAASTGNVYAGGVQCEDAPYPSSYIKTTTVAVTRAADALSFPIGWPPQDLTVYAKVVKPVHATDGTAPYYNKHIVVIGGVTSGGAGIRLGTSGSIVSALSYDSSGTLDAGSETPTWVSGVGSFVAGFKDWSTDIQLRQDNGDGSISAWINNNAGTLTRWEAQAVYVGRSSAAGTEFDGLLLDLVVARGLFTLAEMAACPTP